jgi:hypothetical protein
MTFYILVAVVVVLSIAIGGAIAYNKNKAKVDSVIEAAKK